MGNINNPACTGANFFTYDALVQAATAFPDFANSGNTEHDQLELAAFLGQTSHETTGGWATAPGGPQAWGYCFKEERGCEGGACTGYCSAGNPCADQGFDCTCAAGQTKAVDPCSSVGTTTMLPSVTTSMVTQQCSSTSHRGLQPTQLWRSNLGFGSG